MEPETYDAQGGGKRTAIVVSVALIVIIVIAASYLWFSRSQNDATKALPPDAESALQAQLQQVIAAGDEAGCATLSDARYEAACHDTFTGKKETTPMVLNDSSTFDAGTPQDSTPPATDTIDPQMQELQKIVESGDISGCDALGDEQLQSLCRLLIQDQIGPTNS